ncbi:MAG: hypothetical protein CV081_05950 [Nitrospira sp. LK265]|nr:hypothetical protein [Nitrospira sp. LK265]
MATNQKLRADYAPREEQEGLTRVEKEGNVRWSRQRWASAMLARARHHDSGFRELKLAIRAIEECADPRAMNCYVSH